MSLPYVSMSDAAAHNKEDDVWVIHDGKAYDCTKWQHSHPGGIMAIKNYAGKDCTVRFNQVHSKNAHARLIEFHVANIIPTEGFSLEEVAEHSAAEDLWMAIDGNVYDVTAWQNQHPGGKGSIARSGAMDATEAFYGMHGADHLAKMEKFLLGPLKKEECEKQEGTCTKKVIVAPTTTKYTLLSSERISHDTKRVYFTAADDEKVESSGTLSPGGHMALKIEDNDDGEVVRNYTPVSHKPGTFELIVKAYEGGKGSQFIHSLTEGSTAVFKGPLAPVWDYREARDAASRNAAGIKTLVLVAGGTGIAPMYSIALAALKEKPFAGRVILLACFKDEDDILMEEEVTKLIKSASKPASMHLCMVLSRQKGALKQKRTFAAFSGRLASQHIIMAGIPSVYHACAGVEVVCCGPPTFNDHVGKLFLECGYPAEALHLM